jgi:hypothetical protein
MSHAYSGSVAGALEADGLASQLRGDEALLAAFNALLALPVELLTHITAPHALCLLPTSCPACVRESGRGEGWWS